MPAPRTPWYALVLALLPAACTPGGNAASAEDDVSRQVAATPVEAFFRYGPRDLGSSRATLRAALGAPDSVRARVLVNAHDPAVIDTVFTLHYPGLLVEVYHATYDGRELLASLDITADRYLKKDSPLRLGMLREDVRLALGEPDRDEDGDLFYACASCSLGGQDALELGLDGGRLRRILVRYWID